MSPKDQSSIIPSDRIVVLIPDETLSAKQGVLTVVEKNQPEIGKVIALGSAGYYDDGKVRPMPNIAIDDVIAYRKYGESKFWLKSKQTIFVSFDDILGVIK